MGNPRPKPRHLADKLLQIRERLGLSQGQIAFKVAPDMFYSRISEYERGTREPNLMVLLAYARLAKIPVENLIDDDLDLFD